MRSIVLYVLNSLFRKGYLIKDVKTMAVDVKLKETIAYTPDYFKVVNPHLITMGYFSYLARAYSFEWVLYRAKRCLVDCQSGGVLSGFKIIAESLQNTLGYVLRAGIYKPLILFPIYRRKSMKVNKGFLLTGLMSDNFFHFLIDSLPRVMLYLDILKQDPNVKLIVNRPRKFTLEYLNLLGIDAQMMILMENDLSVDQLYFCNPAYALSNASSRFPNFIYSKSVFSRLSDLIIDKAKRELSQFVGHERIYITRNDVQRRVLLNEEKVYAALSELGFAFVSLSPLKVSEQVLLFFHAKVIVTVHGAGLANLIYARESLIVEIFPCNKKLSTLYQMHQLAQIHDNRHVLFVAEDVTDDQSVFVDPEQLCGVVSDSIVRHERI